MANIIDELKVKTYSYFMKKALDLVESEIDKRQGSIIYDALAPSMATLAQLYADLQLYYENTYLLTAKGKSLDNRCADFGIDRELATPAYRKVTMKDSEGQKVDVPLGIRLSTEDEAAPVFFVVRDRTAKGEYVAVCETVGVVGNIYTGYMLPVNNIAALGSAYMDTIITPGQDDETDDALRNRTIEWLRNKPYGGNVAHYKIWAQAIAGIGAVQVYPVWNGGGTVKISVIDSEYKPATSEFMQQIKKYFDPTEQTGQGLGIAPIDHTVTISTPEEVAINIVANVTLKSEVSGEQIKPFIQASIEKYFLEVKQKWGDNDALNKYQVGVYIARIIGAVISVENVINVQSVTLNGGNADILLEESGTKQQIPKLGTVTVNAIT